MSKHTPGPWLVDCGYIYAACQLDENGMTRQRPLAEVTGDQDHEDHYYENCRLIAAAPELLEALQSVAMWAENQADGQSKGGHATFDLMMLREQRDIARAAIAKATGEQA